MSEGHRFSVWTKGCRRQTRLGIVAASYKAAAREFSERAGLVLGESGDVVVQRGDNSVVFTVAPEVVHRVSRAEGWGPCGNCEGVGAIMGLIFCDMCDGSGSVPNG